MQSEIMLKIGDLINCAGGQKGQIERMRLISSGKLVEEYAYAGDGKDLVLTLKDGSCTMNLWVKDAAIRKIIEKQEQG